MIEFTDGFYRTILIEEPSPTGVSTWLALHPELPGCNAAAAQQDDALAGLDSARQAWIASAEKHGHDVPQALEDPQIQVIYSIDPTAYLNGQQGNAGNPLTFPELEAA